MLAEHVPLVVAAVIVALVDLFREYVLPHVVGKPTLAIVHRAFVVAELISIIGILLPPAIELAQELLAGLMGLAEEGLKGVLRLRRVWKKRDDDHDE